MRPSLIEEHAHYRQHRNESGDVRYREFLSRVTNPLLEVLGPHSRGLDYGCGPGPALAALLTEAGHHVRLYDPLFCPDDDALSQQYDFITCTEVIEHFHNPAIEFRRFDRLLRPGGWLGLMTCFQTDDKRFADWWYRKDPTHVVFYRETTLCFLAAHHGWSCVIPRKDVALMHKPASIMS
ncbi:MAG: class I SAM-dependent methyltransferase [Parvibaculum sp.]